MSALLRCRVLPVCFGLCALLWAPATAWAQQQTNTDIERAKVELNQFRPAPVASDGFRLSRPIDQGHLRVGFMLTLDYADDPLVFERNQGSSSSEDLAIVGDHFVAHSAVTFSLFRRFVLFVGVPLNVLMTGQTPRGAAENLAPADGSSVGDLYGGARVRLLGDERELLALGLQLVAGFPTAELFDPDQAYSGERGFTLWPEALAEMHIGVVNITANLGARFRQPRSLDVTDIGNEFTFALGGSAQVVRHLRAYVEGFGVTGITSGAVGRENTPFEVLAGAKYRTDVGLHVGGALSFGVQRGYGAPDVRLLATLGTAKPPPSKQPDPVVVEASVDVDGDGVTDSEDRCLTVPEDLDNFEDGDGCPELDNDKDGIPDDKDKAPLDPEDMDGFEDEDGAPDLDNDQDGVEDKLDKCPATPEDLDGFEDDDGCPELDNDKDGVLDSDDACPYSPGTKEDGCGRVKVEKGQIVILDRVEFATGKDAILSRSFLILNEVQGTLMANPQIRRIRIEGHTDSRGKSANNLALSRRRALSVARWLIRNGLQRSRIQAYGCGETKPIAPNETKDGRQQNRRVEFRIIDPPPPDGLRSTKGCVEIDIN